MPHPVPVEQMRALLTTLTPTFAANFGTGLRLIGATLPGKAVCAILRPAGDGVTRIVYDPNKPNAMAHTHAMVLGWWERCGAEPCTLTHVEQMEYAPVH